VPKNGHWADYSIQQGLRRTAGLPGLQVRKPRLNPCLAQCGTVPSRDDPHHAQRVREICLYRRSRSCRFGRVLVNSSTARSASGPCGRSVDLARGVIDHLRGFTSTTMTPACPGIRVRAAWRYSPQPAVPRLTGQLCRRTATGFLHCPCWPRASCWPRAAAGMIGPGGRGLCYQPVRTPTR